MKKKFYIALCAAIALTASVSVSANEYNYDITKGEKCLNKVNVKMDKNANGTTIEMTKGATVRTYTTLDSKNITTKWRYTDTKENTDYTVTKDGRNYFIKGTISGKCIDEVVEGEGRPWHQMIGVTGALCLKNAGDNFIYESVREGKGKIVTMSATNEGNDTMLGKPIVKIKVSTAGTIVAGIWSCMYYNDAANGTMLRYEAVEGVPGTTPTVWTLK